MAPLSLEALSLKAVAAGLTAPWSQARSWVSSLYRSE
jgi:hypothetical protein